MRFVGVANGLHPTVRRSGGIRIVGLTAILVLCVSPMRAAAQGRIAQVTFGTETSCEGAGVLSAQECRNAFANANAELDEKAPRFRKRDECERFFHRCMIGDIGRAGFAGFADARVTFIPALRGILILGHSSAERRVLPKVEGAEDDGLFEPRTVAHMDTTESGAKARRAQATWTQRQAALSAPPAPAGVPSFAPTAGQIDIEPTTLNPNCAALVDPLAYNACLARQGPKMNK